jgi:hypothetical protein
VIVGVFDHGGESALPAQILAAKGQAPALQPPRSCWWGVARALVHLLGIQIGSIRCIEGHVGTIVGTGENVRL